ncbi:AAA family ATPase [Chondromyces crocatus]|uniref:ATPase AAA-type core domain-containing protein n=1 Tax=Chondromyces crocatus TaxID=52 RepID=A0A0K1EHX6_CHOCO|nr:AAA family ATPase [Chondromyces crocatus]AKT40464.1 uncharacterized protein CMC5_046190 [Chondromyces crocatus]
MPYGDDVPIIYASAGMRRIVALAYLLIWTWDEHLAAAKVRGEPPAREIIFLIDEIEAHLHARWQRSIVPALLPVMDILTGQHGSRVQLITATHSPLVLASVEPLFHAEKDAWFDLDLDKATRPPSVKLTSRTYVRHGEIGNWLTSEAFDLKEPRSIEGERAVKQARTLMHQGTASATAIAAADQALRDAGLPDIDPFWVRWGYFRDRQAAPAPASTKTASSRKAPASTKTASSRKASPSTKTASSRKAMPSRKAASSRKATSSRRKTT